MFTKPQILSTPHLMAPLGDANAHACGSGFNGCATGFGCQPFQGSSCVDATYVDPVTGAVVGGAVVVVGWVIVK